MQNLTILTVSFAHLQLGKDMKQDIETKIKQDAKSFGRFETLLRKVVSVPKDEILRREKEGKRLKEVKRNTPVT